MIYKKQQKGFTILELILSIFILSLAVAGIFSSFSLMYVLSLSNSDKASATYLAKEGLEIVINARDTNWLNGATWNQGIWPECQNGCQLDYTSISSGQVKPWITPGDYLDSGDGFYRYSLGAKSPTKFKRKITTTLLSDFALKVNSDIFWDQRASVINPQATQGHFALEVILYNWKK